MLCASELQPYGRRMFRNVIGRIAASAAGVQMCAAGVALTDKQLSKKPEWYRKDVLALEDTLKRMGRHGYNTSPMLVNDAYETLKKYAHISNIEIHWRMARALIEKSYFTKCPTEREHLVHEAKECAKKALSFETEKPCAGAHKWYAIALSAVDELNPKADHSTEIVKHLEIAVSLDQDDAYAAFLLGVAHYKKKNYEEALSHFQKAESIKSNFSTSNLYYMGMAHHSSGNKEEARKCFIASYKLHAHNEHELKSRALAKAMLMKLKVKREEYEVEQY
ncbi:tetratricopeptide repeat protein [Cooperia oncophora]